MNSWIVVSLLFSGVDALRKSKRAHVVNNEAMTSTNARGEVGGLYTYGAPKVSGDPLENPRASDGCFPGKRIVNKRRQSPYAADSVPHLLLTFEHPRLDPLFTTQYTAIEEFPCGYKHTKYEFKDTGLHSLELYYRRTAVRYPSLKYQSVVALNVSYTHNIREAAAYIDYWYHRLVGSAVVGTEPSHLIQDPRTNVCFLTFEGSDTIGDWLSNIKIRKVSFCGLRQKVHNGFQKKVTDMVASPTWQQNIRPKLGHCARVDVVGHSLGGAMATLFTACAHNTVAPGADGYDEWQNFWWSKKETKLMPAI